jgi:excisionase family DNA binding protein
VNIPSDQPPPSEQWVSIQEAAQRLGLSVLTVRRRIKAGTLTAELQIGRRGQEYRVRLLGDHYHDDDQSGVKTTLDPAQNVVLSSLVSRLQDQVERLEGDRLALEADRLAKAEAAASWQAKGEALQDELRRAYERIEKLERHRWWQRLLFG